jgi:hypothetical protein
MMGKYKIALQLYNNFNQISNIIYLVEYQIFILVGGKKVWTPIHKATTALTRHPVCDLEILYIYFNELKI